MLTPLMFGLLKTCPSKCCGPPGRLCPWSCAPPQHEAARWYPAPAAGAVAGPVARPVLAHAHDQGCIAIKPRCQSGAAGAGVERHGICYCLLPLADPSQHGGRTAVRVMQYCAHLAVHQLLQLLLSEVQLPRQRETEALSPLILAHSPQGVCRCTGTGDVARGGQHAAPTAAPALPMTQALPDKLVCRKSRQPPTASNKHRQAACSPRYPFSFQTPAALT